MAALASVEYWCSDLRWCYLQPNSPFVFFQSACRTPSFPTHWPSLVSTARSPNILWRLWSHKPLHKHDSNKYQSKAFVICDHKSDETRSVTLVNKAYLVWLMFRVLSNQHYQHRTNQKLCSWANAVFQNRVVCGQAVPSSPLPLPLPRQFVCLLSFQLCRRTRAETLATQARLNVSTRIAGITALKFPGFALLSFVYLIDMRL